MGCCRRRRTRNVKNEDIQASYQTAIRLRRRPRSGHLSVATGGRRVAVKACDPEGVACESGAIDREALEVSILMFPKLQPDGVLG